MPTTQFLFFLFGLMGCTASDDKDTSNASQETTSTAACQEATVIASTECFELNCFEAEPMTCSYGEVSYEGDDCGCYTEGKLYELLCAAGNEASLEELQAGISCQ